MLCKATVFCCALLLACTVTMAIKLEDFNGDWTTGEIVCNGTKLKSGFFGWFIKTESENEARIGVKVLNNVSAKLTSSGQDSNGLIVKVSDIISTMMAGSSDMMQMESDHMFLLGSMNRLKLDGNDKLIIRAEDCIATLNKKST